MSGMLIHMDDAEETVRNAVFEVTIIPQGSLSLH